MGHENLAKAEEYVDYLIKQAEKAQVAGLQKLFLVGLPKVLSLATTPERAQYPLPEEYEVVKSRAELDDESLQELVEAYRRVFGDDEVNKKTGEVIWGEGWKCPKCGKVFPLKAASESENCPACGGSGLAPFYPPNELQERFLNEIEPNSDIKSCLGILKGNEGEVAGFVECSVGSWQDIASRIIESRFQGNEAEGMELMSKVRQALEIRKANVDNILYEDEMGIVREGKNGDNYRESIKGGFYNLARIALEHGVYEGAKEAVFWTSKKSQVYKLARIYGFDPIVESEGYMFLYHADIESLLKLQQNISLETIERFTR